MKNMYTKKKKRALLLQQRPLRFRILLLYVIVLSNAEQFAQNTAEKPRTFYHNNSHNRISVQYVLAQEHPAATSAIATNTKTNFVGKIVAANRPMPKAAQVAPVLRVRVKATPPFTYSCYSIHMQRKGIVLIFCENA